MCVEFSFRDIGKKKNGASFINGKEGGRENRLVEHATFISTVRLKLIPRIVLIIGKSLRLRTTWGGATSHRRTCLPTNVFYTLDNNNRFL